MLQPWLGIALVICAFALLRWVQAQSRRRDLAPQLGEQVLEKLTALEQRLTDMQELMLAVDEKLEQMPVPRLPVPGSSAPGPLA